MKKRKKLPAQQQLDMFNKETNMTNTATILIALAIAIAIALGYLYATTHGVIIF
jgi:hypothetical protein